MAIQLQSPIKDHVYCVCKKRLSLSLVSLQYLRATVSGVRERAEEQRDMVMLLLCSSGNLKDDLYIRVEVAGDSNSRPVLGGLESHTVDTGNELVRRIQEGAHASVRVRQSMDSDYEGTKAGQFWSRDLMLNGNLISCVSTMHCQSFTESD